VGRDRAHFDSFPFPRGFVKPDPRPTIKYAALFLSFLFPWDPACHGRAGGCGPYVPLLPSFLFFSSPPHRTKFMIKPLQWTGLIFFGFLFFLPPSSAPTGYVAVQPHPFFFVPCSFQGLSEDRVPRAFLSLSPPRARDNCQERTMRSSSPFFSISSARRVLTEAIYFYLFPFEQCPRPWDYGARSLCFSFFFSTIRRGPR